jgi:hypothetical protein
MVLTAVVVGRGLVTMADNLDVDPDALRTVGNACYNKAADCRKVAEPNPEFDLSGFGNGAYGFISPTYEYVKTRRRAGWRGVAERYQNMGDIHHVNASNFESGDAAGGAWTARTEDEF